MPAIAWAILAAFAVVIVASLALLWWGSQPRVRRRPRGVGVAGLKGARTSAQPRDPAVAALFETVSARDRSMALDRAGGVSGTRPPDPGPKLTGLFEVYYGLSRAGRRGRCRAVGTLHVAYGSVIFSGTRRPNLFVRLVAALLLRRLGLYLVQRYEQIPVQYRLDGQTARGVYDLDRQTVSLSGGPGGKWVAAVLQAKGGPEREKVFRELCAALVAVLGDRLGPGELR